MTTHLKKRMENAGLPSTGFGFHSCRSGFMACAFLANTSESQTLDGLVCKVAMLTGWQPYSPVEFVYFKNTTKSHLITTDMIGLT